ncbi:MAG: hypothetical protein AB7O59_19395 [Pirellulales bacterium]
MMVLMALATTFATSSPVLLLTGRQTADAGNVKPAPSAAAQ